MKRGDVYWADLKPRSGSEQRGHRPVILLSHDAFNETPTWCSVIVVPCSTSKIQGRRGPTSVNFPAGTANLPEATTAICHQLTTLDRSKLTQKIGRLTEPFLRMVEAGIRAAIDLPE